MDSDDYRPDGAVISGEEGTGGDARPPGPERNDPAEAAVASLRAVGEELAALREQVAGLNERARHREAVIDRLHAENQELRAGERRAVLDPAITDLVRLHGQLEREGNGLIERGEGKVGGLLHSLADDVLLALERVGVEPFSVQVGDPFRTEIHRPLSAISTDDPERANTIAVVVSQGFRDMETGRVRRKAQAHFHRYIEGRPEGDPGRRGSEEE
ncbi:hypothetical protein GCM10027294_37950 [Marinactinospora endophytica]